MKFICPKLFSKFYFFLINFIIYFCITFSFYIYICNSIVHITDLCVNLLRILIILAILLIISYILLIGRLLQVYSRERELLLYNNIHRRRNDHQPLLEATEPPQQGKIIPNSNTETRYIQYSFYTLYFFSFIIFVLLAVAFSLIVFVQIHTIPQSSGTISLPGLISESRIDRDSDGLIFISASNDHDLYFTQGVVTAQNRLWQMEFQRRVGSGTLSAIVGNQKAAIQLDSYSRVVGFREAAESALPAIDETVKQAIQAYIDGVNAYLNSNPPLSIEFYLLGHTNIAPFTIVDSLVWAKVFAGVLSGNLDKELMRYDLNTRMNLTRERIDELIPPYQNHRFPTVIQDGQKQYPTTVSPSSNLEFEFSSINDKENIELDSQKNFNELQLRYRLSVNKLLESGINSHHPLSSVHPNIRSIPRIFRSFFGPSTASNNWVVGSSRTASGKPLLSNDPHLQFMAPNIWMLISLQTPTYRAVGSSFPLVPFIVIGRNSFEENGQTESIGWAVTNVGTDCQDLYVMDSVNFTHYRYKGEIVPYTIVNAEIGIKNSDSKKFQFRRSHFGPVLTDIPLDVGDATQIQFNSIDSPLSLRWTNLDANDTTISSFYYLSRARNFDEFRFALKFFVVPSQNFLYADTRGNIGYQLPGKVPIRVSGHDGRFPTLGDGKTDWRGYLPFDSLPSVYNPTADFIASANNQVTNSSWPSNMAITHDWDEGSDGYRAMRITELINQHNGHTVDSMHLIQSDYHSLMCQDFHRWILPKLNGRVNSGSASYWLDRVLSWDCVLSVGSQEASMFSRFYTELTRLPAKELNQSIHNNPIYLINVFNVTGNVQSDKNCYSSADGGCLGWAANAWNYVAENANLNGWGKVDRNNKPAAWIHQLLGETLLACAANRYVDHGGDDYTVNVGTFDPPTSNEKDGGCMNSNFMPAIDSTADFPQTHGAAFRQIIDFKSPESSKFIIGLGQSGAILDNEYDNLLEKWANTEYLNMKIDANNIKNTIKLKPQ